MSMHPPAHKQPPVDDDSDTICIVEFDSGKVTVPMAPYFSEQLDLFSDEPLQGGYCGTDGPCEGCQ